MSYVGTTDLPVALVHGVDDLRAMTPEDWEKLGTGMLNIIEISAILLLVIAAVVVMYLLLERMKHLEERNRLLTHTLDNIVNTLQTTDSAMEGFNTSTQYISDVLHLIVSWMQYHSNSSGHLYPNTDEGDTITRHTNYGDYTIRTYPTSPDPNATHPLPFDDDTKPSGVGGQPDGLWGEPGTTEPMLSQRLRVEPERLYPDYTDRPDSDDDTDKLHTNARPDTGAEGVPELLPYEH